MKFIVNPGDAVHQVGAELAETLLRSPGFREATHAEARAWCAAHAPRLLSQLSPSPDTTPDTATADDTQNESHASQSDIRLPDAPAGTRKRHR